LLVGLATSGHLSGFRIAEQSGNSLPSQRKKNATSGDGGNIW
jgi:hypothetical protein